MVYTKLNPSLSNQYTDTVLFQGFDQGIADAHANFGGIYNVKNYGAVEDGGPGGTGTNDTAAIQAAIDSAYAANGGVVVLNAKNYSVDTITLKRGVRLVGKGSWATNLYVRSGSNTGIFQIPLAQVRTVGVAGMVVYGHASNTSQHGMYLYAQPDTSSPFDGGLWYSKFFDLQFLNIGGTGIWLRGGSSGFQIPNQFLKLELVRIFHTGTSTSRALQCTGQVGQVNFDQCEFDGATTGSGTNIYIGRELDGSGNPVGANTPYTLNFWGCTTQKAQKGFVIDSAKSVNISECYFEDLYESIEAKNGAMGVVIDKSRFANAGHNPGGTGYLIKAASSSEVTVREITDLGATDNHIINSGASVSADGFFAGGTSALPVTSGITLQGVAASTFSLYKDNNWLVTPGVTINDLLGEIFPGNLVFLRSWGGSVSYSNTGNIHLGGRTSPLTIPDGGVATFLRTDLGGTHKWVLISDSSVA